MKLLLRIGSFVVPTDAVPKDFDPWGDYDSQGGRKFICAVGMVGTEPNLRSRCLGAEPHPRADEKFDVLSSAFDVSKHFSP